MFNIERKRIYKHTELDQRTADRLIPLVENAFRDQLAQYDSPSRKSIRDEKVRFITEQYANRQRIAKNMGVGPLFEDSNIFGGLSNNMKNLFESVSAPENMINMGDVANPDAGGNIWNQGYKPGTGDIPSYVFGLQSHIAMHCIGFDLLPTIAVDTPKIVVSYVDTVYGGGALDSTESLPSYIEVASSTFTRAWIKARTLKRTTSEVIVISDTASGKKAMKLRFVVGSTVKAAMVVEVLATGVCTTLPVHETSLGAYTWNNSYSVKAISDIIADTSKTHNVVIENGTAAETYVAAITDFYVGYASATRTNIAEAASNDNSIGGMKRSQQEKGPKHKLNVVTMDKQLEMVGIEIEADTTNIQIKDMAAMGINVIAYLYTGVQNQLVQTLDETITKHLYKMGTTHLINAYRSQGINHSLYIDAPSTTHLVINQTAGSNQKAINVDMTDMTGNDVGAALGTIPNTILSSGYENQMTHGERLFSRILLVAEFVHQQNRIGAPDILVLGGELAATVKRQSTFSACPVPSTLTQSPELSYSGTIFETINVYKNPRIDFDDPRVLLARRGNDKDPGSKLLAYDLAASRQIVAERTMAEKIRVWSRFQIADIGFYPELNYYTFIAYNGYKFS